MNDDVTERNKAIMEHDFVFAARVAHEANRAYCVSLGDDSQKPWEHADAAQRTSLIDGARFIVENPKSTPEDQHDNWLRLKHADGWTWGPVKDTFHKKHPNMRPYNELPREQRAKDLIFRAVVRTVLGL